MKISKLITERNNQTYAISVGFNEISKLITERKNQTYAISVGFNEDKQADNRAK